MTEHFIGLMSGTSLDGVDGVLLVVHGEHPPSAPAAQGQVQVTAQSEPDRACTCQVLAHASSALPPTLRHELLALNRNGPNELHRAALAANALVQVYAQVVALLLAQTGLTPEQVRAVGAHGQTLRHRPGEFDGTGYTLQLNNPALLAERCGIAVVADFRSRDVAAGGQGAPLVPAFHQQLFARRNAHTLVLNVGGIANLSVLPPRHGETSAQAILGFDCGPGNVLMDLWCQEQRGLPYDAGGAWAAGGRLHPELLARLQDEAFFQAPPPKSTGRDLFHAEWLARRLADLPGPAPTAADVQATLCELTAQSCVQAMRRHAPQALQGMAPQLLVCGGGALNTHLMHRLQALLPEATVASTATRGLPPLQVEAAAFAWLARQTVHGLSGNLPRVTGAQGARVLGCVYPA